MIRVLVNLTSKAILSEDELRMLNYTPLVAENERLASFAASMKESWSSENLYSSLMRSGLVTMTSHLSNIGTLNSRPLYYKGLLRMKSRFYACSTDLVVTFLDQSAGILHTSKSNVVGHDWN